MRLLGAFVIMALATPAAAHFEADAFSRTSYVVIAVATGLAVGIALWVEWRKDRDR